MFHFFKCSSVRSLFIGVNRIASLEDALFESHIHQQTPVSRIVKQLFHQFSQFAFKILMLLALSREINLFMTLVGFQV